MNDIVEIRAQNGPQKQFLKSNADIALYGGAAGGGKTWALLMEPLYHIGVPGFGAVIFRRTTPQVKNEGGLWDTSMKIYPQMEGDNEETLTNTPKDSIIEWTFKPENNRVKFAHLEYEKNVLDWQGPRKPGSV